MTNWKSKLGNFKTFLDSLGTEFQALRGESIHLRIVKSSLNKEGNELRNNIEDIRAQISQATSTLHQKKNHRLEYEDIISGLRHSLESSSANFKLAQSRLFDERKRSTTLEANLQNYCYTQEQQLGLTKSGQFNIEKKIDSTLDAMSRVWNMLPGSSVIAHDSTIQRSSANEVQNSEKTTCSSLVNDSCMAQINELESQLVKVSQEFKAAHESLRVQHDEHDATKHTLCEVNKTLEEAETKAIQHASEIATLQKKIKITESEVREELSRASVISRGQSRARFDQQLHGILREKTALQQELATTQSLLVHARKAQVS